MKSHIDILNERDYREWSAKVNRDQLDAAPAPNAKQKYPKSHANMVVKNWVDLRCACQQKVSS